MTKSRAQWKDPFLNPKSCDAMLKAESPQIVREFLRNAPKVRSLFVYGCVGRDWPVFSECAKLEELGVNAWKHPTLEPLRQLTKLQHLWLNIYGKITDLSPLASLHNLRSLRINSGAYIHDVTPLTRARSLRHLELTSWTGTYRFDSVTQFARISQLRTLSLMSQRFIKGNIRDLAALRHLTQLHLDNRYPIEDVTWLAARFPTIRGWLFNPIIERGLECPKCHREGVLLVGVARGTAACRKCDADRITAHIKRYRRLRNEATVSLRQMRRGERQT